VNSLEHLASSEIDEMIVSKEKELQEAMHSLAVVEEAKNRLSRQILELQIKKKDTENTLSKANFNVKTINSELRVLKSAFWKARNENR